MHYLADYGLYLAKILTFLAALLFFVIATLALITKNKSRPKSGTLSINKINDKYQEMEDLFHKEMLDKKAFKSLQKIQKKKEKERPIKKRAYLLKFDGDIRASAVESLREEITAILGVASPQDEVIVCVESAGGMVHSYGLAASQLQRVKDKRIPLTIIIDKVAASGGYLMACVGHKILAAPFAIIGSIGVVAQIPNFHRWLQKNNIDFEQITAGQYKRTLTVFGENTNKDREKFKEDIEEVHHYFKAFITENRPIVNIEQVATGEHWLATRALELKLIDGLSSSDDYLFSLSQTTDIFEVTYKAKKSFPEKISQLIKHYGFVF
ncbi:MAG TPA: protease SohB [Gammaproteobacteria bacterium]|nr:protease SohB [Gammaproteobacteria bacterium]